jgi:hypothetical protein
MNAREAGMTDKNAIEEYIGSRPAVQSVGELKKSLMRRAWDGQSKHTPAQMILLIQWRLSANRVTEQDRAVLDDLNSFKMSDPPRSILMLDALAREAEKEQVAQHGKVLQRTRYEYNPATVPAPHSLQ